jgi:2-keto-4-pentenoate hydratase/2-oxohepta-3-ene-1,7-dioic acid hydratase in catechol pathway
MTSKDHWLDAHKNGTPWTISKAFDTSTPVGKFIEKSQIPEPQEILKPFFPMTTPNSISYNISLQSGGN